MVAWIVVMAIVGVVSTILAIYFYVDSNRVTGLLDTQTKAYSDVLTQGMLSGDEVTALKAAREDPTNNFDHSMKLLQVSMAQRDRLAKLISGGEEDAKAVAAAATAIDKAKASGVKPAGENLIATVDALVTENNARKTEADNNRKDSETSKAKLLETINATQAQVDTLTKSMEALRGEKDAALQRLQDVSKQQSDAFTGTADDMRKQLQAANDQINQINAQNATLDKQITDQKREMDRLKERLNGLRIDPSKAIVQRPDGKIIRIASGNDCFIDLGKGDGVTPGLTFEVYDKVEGIPAAGEASTEENLPVGKASIEVVEVGQGSSRCHINRRSLGTVLAEGDLIVNLVYDRNTKYNFVVHGNFDLDQNGNATPADAEVVKRLITSWGGKVVNDINVDTDFVVLGKEPAIPEKPTEPDPLKQKEYEDAMAAYDQYQEMSKKARDYRIPILNQNRFLYLIGFYDQAKR
jgi:hypothetical protein